MTRARFNAALAIVAAVAIGGADQARAEDLTPPQLTVEAAPIDEAQARGLAAALRTAAQRQPQARARVRLALQHRPAADEVVTAPAEPAAGAASAGAAGEPAAAAVGGGTADRQPRLRQGLRQNRAARQRRPETPASTPAAVGPDVARGLVDDAAQLGQGARRGAAAAGDPQGARGGGGSGRGAAAAGASNDRRLHAAPETVQGQGPHKRGGDVESGTQGGGERGPGHGGASGVRGRKLSPTGGAGGAGAGGGGRRGR